VSHRLLLPIILLVVGLGLAGLVGEGVIGRDHDLRREEALDSLTREARGLVDEGSELLTELAAELRDDGRGTRWWLTAEGAVLPRAPGAATPLLSSSPRIEAALATGERLAAAGEPLRAIDALTLPLAAPETPVPSPDSADGIDRARLRLAAGRIALEVPTMAAWGESVLRALAAFPSPARGAASPVDLLAALALPPGSVPVTELDLSLRLDEVAPQTLAALHRRFSVRAGWSDDAPGFLAELEERREDQRIVRSVWSPEGVALPRLVDGHLVLAADPARATMGSFPVELLVERVEAELPSPRSPRTARWLPPEGEPLLAAEGAPLATLVIDDPTLPALLESIDRRATRLRLLLVGVLAIVGVAVLTTALAIDRQRRLAALRMRLLANVSHELKTPVTSVRMLGELLEEGALPPERVREFGRLIARESRRLHLRIEEILETARGEQDRTPLPRAPLELGPIIAEAVGLFRERVEADGGCVEIRGESAPLHLETNRDAVSRILENLIENAMKYGRDEESGRAPRIEVETRRRGESIDIAVSDDGPGIPAKERDSIFEAFYRGRFDDFGVPGSGLGLAISRSLALRLGGSLSHAPRRGGGSRFTLALPVAGAIARPEPEPGREKA
jgi:signal transduction histidine kinase